MRLRKPQFYKKRPSEWSRKERIQFSVPVVVAILAIVIPLIVTRGGGGGTNSKLDLNRSSTSAPPPAGTYYASLGGKVSLSDGTQSATIQLTRIIDPASGNNAFLGAGDRYLATEFRLSDTSKSPVTNIWEFDGATTITGTDGLTYSADQVDTVSECTSFHNGPYQIVTGQSVTECVVFQIPTNVSVSEVVVTVGNERGIWSSR